MLGDLSQVSLSKIMRAIALERRTGLLSVWSDEGIYRLAFADGKLMAAIAPDESDTLKKKLQTAFALDPQFLRDFAKSTCPEQAFGSCLKEESYLSQAQLQSLFDQQLDSACYPLFMLTQGQFRLSHTMQLPYEEMTGIEGQTLAITLTGLRRMTASKEGLQRLPQSECMLQRMVTKLPSLPLTDVEKAIWQHLPSQKRLKDLSRYILANLLEVRQATMHLLELQIIQQVTD